MQIVVACDVERDGTERVPLFGSSSIELDSMWVVRVIRHLSTSVPSALSS